MVTLAKNGPCPTALEAQTAQADNDGSAELERELIDRGVSPKTAQELVAVFPEERIRVQIEQTDWLKKTGRRKIVDRGAFLRLDDDHAHRRLAGVVAGTDLEGLGLVHA